jgi:cellobiose phosphorylase
MSADVYAHPPHAGRGGWSWYTGSAGWMYQLILESVLGLTLEHRDGQAWLLLRPCLPPHWRECEVRYRFRDTPYRITLARNDAMAADLLSVDGVAQPVNDIALQDDRRPHEAVMSLATTERLEPSSHPAER